MAFLPFTSSDLGFLLIAVALLVTTCLVLRVVAARGARTVPPVMVAVRAEGAVPATASA